MWQLVGGKMEKDSVPDVEHVLTSMRPSLSSFWWHRQQLPPQQTAASAATETETDYPLHLTTAESEGHYQLTWKAGKSEEQRMI